MGSSTSKGKGAAMTGSKLPQIGMAGPYSSNVSKGNKGKSDGSYHNMKK